MMNIINEIHNKNISAVYPETLINQAESLNAISGDIYSTATRFVYELIQNADDASYADGVNICIKLVGDFLVISHTGMPFNERDLNGICAVNNGTKKKTGKTIGYKGIGFKSVFTQNKARVFIRSDSTFFEFNKVKVTQLAWQQVWGDQVEWEQKSDRKFSAPWQIIPTMCTSENIEFCRGLIGDFPSFVDTIIELDQPEKIFSEIRDLIVHNEFLLFLNNTKGITIEYGDFKVEYAKQSNEDGTTSLLVNHEIKSFWWLYQSVIPITQEIRNELAEDNKTPEKLKEAESIDMTFAYKLNKLEDGYSLIPLKADESRLYTYLPTEVKCYDFPFLVNANFLVDASREKIRVDNALNKHIFYYIGKINIVAAKEIISDIQSINDNLACVKIHYTLSESLEKSFNLGLDSVIKTIPFIKINKSTMGKISEIIIDKTQWRNKFTDDYVKLVEHLSKYKPQITYDHFIDHKEINSVILTALGVMVFDKLHAISLIKDEDFVTSLSLSDNERLLNYLFLLFKTVKGKDQFFGDLQSAKVIPLESGEKESIKFVNEPFDLEDYEWINDVNTIDKSIFEKIKKSDEFYQWFCKLGLSKPSKLTYLENVLLPDLDNTVTKDNHLYVVNYLFDLFSEDLITQPNLMKLKKLLVLCNDNKLHIVSKSTLSEKYNPDVRPNLFGEDIPELHECYLKKCSNIFFEAIGIKNNITFQSINCKNQLFFHEFIESNISFAQEKHRYDYLVSNSHADYITIQLFGEYLPPDTENEAKEYWIQVFKNNNVEFIKEDFEHSIIASKEYETAKICKLYTINKKTYIDLDAIHWGWRSSNRASFPLFLRYYLQKNKLLPSLHHGLMESKKLFLNTKEVTELAGDSLPIISHNEPLSEGWAHLLGLKIDLEIEDLITILESLPHKLDDNIKQKLKSIYQGMANCLDNGEICLTPEEAIPLLCNNGNYTSKPIYIPEYSDNEFNNENEFIYIPKEFHENKKFIDFISEQFNVVIIDQFRIEKEILHEDVGSKLKIIKHLPLFLAYDLVSIPDIQEFINKLCNIEIYICSTLNKEYWLADTLQKKEICQYLKNDNRIYIIDEINVLTVSNISKLISEYLSSNDMSSQITLCLTSILNLLNTNDFNESQLVQYETLTNHDVYINFIESVTHKKIDTIGDEYTQETIHNSSSLNSDLISDHKMDKETQIMISDQAILDAKDYLKKKGFYVKEDKESIDRYLEQNKIVVMNYTGEKLSFHVRSARKGMLYINYTIWDSLLRDDQCLLVYVTNEDPLMFNSRQDIMNNTISDSVDISLIHNKNEDYIESLFNGSYLDKDYDEIPKTTLAFKINQDLSKSIFEIELSEIGKLVKLDDNEELA